MRFDTGSSARHRLLIEFIRVQDGIAVNPRRDTAPNPAGTHTPPFLHEMLALLSSPVGVCHPRGSSSAVNV
jgi:hypothetical protein